MTELKISNISGYLFATLHDLKSLRLHLLENCKRLGLKGTILISEEGVNVFLAGDEDKIHEAIAIIRAIPGLEKFQAKFSPSDHQPFSRMLVKIKQEIIAFGVEGVKPAEYTSPRVYAKELKQWLDEGREVVLYDTRNDYEIKLGTFKNAIPAQVNHFRDFPRAVRELPEELKKKTIVTFCTGGIRCEKAAPFMEMEGFENIYQLEGGILKYFEEVGSDHYDGECFVFDHRVGVDPSLRETHSAVCYICQTPLDAHDQEDTRYVVGKSCPYCYKTDAEKTAQAVAERQAKINALTHPLPGATPYVNRRPLNIKANEGGLKLIDALCMTFPFIEREEWQKRIAEQRFRTKKDKILTEDYIVRAGERLIQLMPEAAEPDVNANIKLIHEDEACIVIKKPAPLPMHPSGRFHRNTLQHILEQAYVGEIPRPLHRLDANTTGVVLLARTRHFCKLLQRQFLNKSIEKKYLARVQGVPEWQTYSCKTAIIDEAEKSGARNVDDGDSEVPSLPCHTDFKVLKTFSNNTTLIEAIPHTGRTNQIRVHLWSLGFPIVGDATYLPDGKMGDTQTLAPDAPPLCLHAQFLSFTHPVSGKRMSYSTENPSWVE